MNKDCVILVMLVYFIGIIYEFILTIRLISSSEKHKNYLYNEIKINNFDAVLAIFIVSCAWVPIRIIKLMNLIKFKLKERGRY